MYVALVASPLISDPLPLDHRASIAHTGSKSQDRSTGSGCHTTQLRRGIYCTTFWQHGIWRFKRRQRSRPCDLGVLSCTLTQSPTLTCSCRTLQCQVAGHQAPNPSSYRVRCHLIVQLLRRSCQVLSLEIYDIRYGAI